VIARSARAGLMGVSCSPGTLLSCLYTTREARRNFQCRRTLFLEGTVIILLWNVAPRNSKSIRVIEQRKMIHQDRRHTHLNIAI
jgi:hypothetical protein